MRILNLRPVAAPGGTGTFAIFDVDLSPHLRLLDVELKRTRTGEIRSWPAKKAGQPTAALHPDLADEISRAAMARLEGGSLDATNRD